MSHLYVGLIKSRPRACPFIKCMFRAALSVKHCHCLAQQGCGVGRRAGRWPMCSQVNITLSRPWLMEGCSAVGAVEAVVAMWGPGGSYRSQASLPGATTGVSWLAWLQARWAVLDCKGGSHLAGGPNSGCSYFSSNFWSRSARKILLRVLEILWNSRHFIMHPMNGCIWWKAVFSMKRAFDEWDTSMYIGWKAISMKSCLTAIRKNGLTYSIDYGATEEILKCSWSKFTANN